MMTTLITLATAASITLSLLFVLGPEGDPSVKAYFGGLGAVGSVAGVVILRSRFQRRPTPVLGVALAVCYIVFSFAPFAAIMLTYFGIPSVILMIGALVRNNHTNTPKATVCRNRQGPNS